MQTNHPNSPEIEAIQRHWRIYHSTLKSSGEIRISHLQQTHDEMKPTLHLGAGTSQIDIATFIYTSLRLPNDIFKVKNVVLGQSTGVFQRRGYPQIESWQKVFTPGRRRRLYFNRRDTLACFITSISDIDDLINILIAFQEEWNKLHDRLNLFPLKQIARNLDSESWQNLQSIWGTRQSKMLHAIKKNRLDFTVKLLAGSWLDYTKVVQKWWKNISASLKPELRLTPNSIYFVSSNTHSLLNLASGYALTIEKKIAAFLADQEPALAKLYRAIKTRQQDFPLQDLLYYAFKKNAQADPSLITKKQKFEENLGIRFIPAEHYLDVNVQVIPVKLLAQSRLDPRLKINSRQRLAKNPDFIFNIDYPLGFAAYHVLTETMENMAEIKGVYITGKAASLNGNVGDVLIPKIVYDEHSQNSYLITNCFNHCLTQKLRHGSILDNQKAVSVLGTFLQNQALIDQYSRGNQTILEMENGPYLSAITEAVHPHRFPNQTVVDLTNTPFDLGIINYVSDTPYSKAKSLGVRNLSLEGVEPTYFASRVILQRIIDQAELK